LQAAVAVVQKGIRPAMQVLQYRSCSYQSISCILKWQTNGYGSFVINSVRSSSCCIYFLRCFFGVCGILFFAGQFSRVLEDSHERLLETERKRTAHLRRARSYTRGDLTAFSSCSYFLSQSIWDFLDLRCHLSFESHNFLAYRRLLANKWHDLDAAGRKTTVRKKD
jgi:hypothetical protein